jgi:DNA-binding SARP family transcriptional activator/TolB-like protein/Tfp pilus assembly protein PilF
MPDATFTLTSLGDLRLDGPAGPVLRARRKELVLLVYLVRRAPRPVSRDELIALLWGDRDEEKARQSLRQALHQLRQALGTALEVSGDSVRMLEGTIALDVAMLERDLAAGLLDDAIGRWNGVFLRDTEDVGDETYRAWLEREREALRRSVGSAFKRVAAAAQAAGRINDEIRCSRQWSEHFPLDEQAHVHLIDALRRKGDTGDARAIYAAFLARLKVDLDATPSLELIRLGESLEGLASTERRRQSGTGAVHAPALVGRGAAIGTSLVEAWSRVREEAAVVVIEGDKGLGKTRLCTDLVRRASSNQRPMLLLKSQAESGADFTTLRRLSGALVHAPIIEEAPHKALSELAGVIPGLTERFPHLTAPNGRTDRLEAAFRDTLRAIAARAPVLVILDDAQHADAASIRVLRAMAVAPPPGIMLMLTLSTDDPSSAAIATEFGELPGVRRYKLAPLSVADVQALVDSMLDVAPESRSALVALLHNESAGVPQAVTWRISQMIDRGELVLNNGSVWELRLPVVKPAQRDAELATLPAIVAAPPHQSPGRQNGAFKWSRQRIIMAAVGLAALALIPFTRTNLFREPVANANGAPRVAVLDLELLTPDTSAAFLATGLAEEINLSLLRLEGLRVKSRGVVRAAQASGASDPVQLGQSLQVDYLVEGVLRRAGPGFKVSIRLTQASDGFQVWSEDFDADADLPRLRDRIAREVALRVGTRLGSEAVPRAVTGDARAYEHYLRGNYYLARRTPPTAQQAVAQYQAAVARDSTFAAAYARIAYAYALLLDWGWAHDARSPEQLFHDGLGLVQRALEIDSLSADAWMARAYLLATSDPVRLQGAAEAFERAIELDPRNAEAMHQYAQVQQVLGNWDAAVAGYRRTLVLEPDRSLPYVSMASIAWKQGQPLRARRLYDSALVVDPGASYALSARALLRLFALRDPEGGLEDAETAVRVSDGYSIPPHSVLAIALARTGSQARAELEVERALAALIDRAVPSPTDARFIGSALLAVGRRNDALNLLERTRPRGAWLWFYCLSQDFDPIRSDKRFVRIMQDAHP